MATFQTLPGFREFYPEDLARRNHVFRLWRQTANNFGFAEYDAPVLEPLDLYKAKSGDEIEGQLFAVDTASTNGTCPVGGEPRRDMKLAYGARLELGSRATTVAWLPLN